MSLVVDFDFLEDSSEGEGAFHLPFPVEVFLGGMARMIAAWKGRWEPVVREQVTL